MKMNKRVYIYAVVVLLCSSNLTVAQSGLAISLPTGLKVMVIQKDFPLLKLLLPGQPDTERGIEIEFPEHVTGLNEKNSKVEHLYLVSNGNDNKRTLPVWRVEGNSLIYETELEDKVKISF